MTHDGRREARRERSQRFVARQLADTYGAAWSPAELRSNLWVKDRRAYAREAAALAVPGTEIRATVYQLSNGSWCWRTEDPGAQRQADVGTCYTEGAARLDAGRAVLQRLQDKINDAQRALGGDAAVGEQERERLWDAVKWSTSLTRSLPRTP